MAVFSSLAYLFYFLLCCIQRLDFQRFAMNPSSAPEKTDKKQRNLLVALVMLIFIGTFFYSKKLFCWLFNKCPKCGNRFVWYQIHKGWEETRIKICAKCCRLNPASIIARTGFFHGFVYIAAIFLFLALIIVSCFGGCGGGDGESENSSVKIANDIHAGEER